jgi:DNA-binding response OmpR family regulator
MARVGLLEDNTRIARLCAMMLCYAGHEVSIYEHPRDCLCALHLFSDALPAGEPCSSLKSLPIDVLILDLHLPDITGIEIIHCLRSQPLTKSIPLIFCTAATPNEVSRAMSLAPKANFLEKPFSYSSLVSAIGNALQVQRA